MAMIQVPFDHFDATILLQNKILFPRVTFKYPK